MRRPRSAQEGRQGAGQAATAAQPPGEGLVAGDGDAGEQVGVAADEFGGAMHDHVRAEGQGLLQQRRGEGVVDADECPGPAAGGAQGGQVGHLEQRVGGGFQPEQVCAGDGGLDAGGVGQVDPVDGPAAVLAGVGEQLADPEVAVCRGDDPAAARHQVEHRGDRGHAGGERHGVTALHLAHGCLQRLPARGGVRA